MTAPYRTQRLVEFHDTDMAGIMHFASFFQYLESAEHELLRSLGLSVHSKIAGQTVSFPRVAASCEYQSPAQCEEILDIDIHIARLGTSSITYVFELTIQGRQVATGKVTCVCCRIEPGKPPVAIPLPEEIRQPLQQFVLK